jgi:hypothetical protein
MQCYPIIRVRNQLSKNALAATKVEVKDEAEAEQHLSAKVMLDLSIDEIVQLPQRVVLEGLQVKCPILSRLTSYADIHINTVNRRTG